MEASLSSKIPTMINPTISKRQAKKAAKALRSKEQFQAKKQEKKKAKAEARALSSTTSSSTSSTVEVSKKRKREPADLARLEEYKQMITTKTTADADNRYRVVVDLEWAKDASSWRRAVDVDSAVVETADSAHLKYMNWKEVRSLVTQIQYCHGVNKRARRWDDGKGDNSNSNSNSNNSNSNDNDNDNVSSNVHLHLCNLPPSDTSNTDENDIRTRLDKIAGFPEKWEGLSTTHKDINETDFGENIKKIVYLTSDSDNVITTLNDDTAYVIGGIVDRNRLKSATLEKAERLGIEHGKLPLGGSGSSGAGSTTLTTNHIFEILGRWTRNGRDWDNAVRETVPQRAEKRKELNSTSKRN